MNEKKGQDVGLGIVVRLMHWRRRSQAGVPSLLDGHCCKSRPLLFSEAYHHVIRMMKEPNLQSRYPLHFRLWFDLRSQLCL